MNDKPTKSNNELSVGGPFERLAAARAEMDRLFDNFFTRPFSFSMPSISTALTNTPRVNVQELDNEVVVTADVPGYSDDDIDIETGEGYVRISGTTSSESQSGNPESNYYRMERSSGSFSRVISLPVRVDYDAAEADVDRGVLTIRFPKQPEPEKKKIALKKGSSKKQSE